MLAGLFVVFFVEAPNQFLEDRPHRVVVETRMLDAAITVENRIGAKIDTRIEKLLDQRPERVCFRKARDLIAELKIIDDLLDVGRVAVEIRFEVGLELLLARTGAEVAERKVGRVVKGLACSLSESLVLVGDTGLVERRLHVEHGFFRRL